MITGLEQAKTGKPSILHTYPARSISSVALNANIIELDNEIDPPFCISNPVRESIADVMIVSGGVVSKAKGGAAKVEPGNCCKVVTAPSFPISAPSTSP